MSEGKSEKERLIKWKFYVTHWSYAMRITCGVYWQTMLSIQTNDDGPMGMAPPYSIDKWLIANSI